MPPFWGHRRGDRYGLRDSAVLTDIRCRNAKAADKPRKLPDAFGLILYITPAGAKSWRFKYRFHGKEKQLTFGLYPAVSLAEAREQRDAARKLIQDGVDPSVRRKQQRAHRKIASSNTFESIARGWHGAQSSNWTPRYGDQVLARLEAGLFPAIGNLPIDQVTVPLVVDALRTAQTRNSIEIAHRLRQYASDIFQAAIAAGITTTNPAADMRKALGKVITGRRPAVRGIAKAAAVLRKVEASPAYATTRLASRLLALTAARPGVVRLAEASEFEDLDGPAPIWRVPAEKMKLTMERKRDADFEFIVPLARQAVEAVRVAIRLAGDQEILFPGATSAKRPISDSTLSKLYREAGFRGVHVPHGWRATFSTQMNEIAAIENRVGDREIIDLMLAHMPTGVEPIYNRYAYMPRRREIAQEWADLLTASLAAPEDLLLHAWGSSPRNRRRGHDRVSTNKA